MNYFEADRLDLYMTHLNTFVSNAQVGIESNAFYVTRPWNSASVSTELTKKLCEFLQLPSTTFEGHIRSLLTMSADDYFRQLGILPVEDSSPPEQSTERVNDELFQRFEHLSAADLFLTGLELQDSIWKGSIYYYTHLEGAVALLRQRTIPARFHFHPPTSIQRSSENPHPVPVYFCLRLRDVFTLPELRWRVTSTDGIHHDSSREMIRRFDFARVYRDDSIEFLIDNPSELTQLPKDAISLVFQNLHAKSSFECLLKDEDTLMYPCHINKEYFFNTNNSIHVNHHANQDYISVHVDRSPLKGIIIVQVRSQLDLACDGDLRAVFHCDDLTTIYAREKPIKIHVGQQPYAVYYEEDEQRWLIYINHHQSEFDRRHREQHPQFVPSNIR